MKKKIRQNNAAIKTIPEFMQPHPASYRDTEGFIFKHDGNMYRYIHPNYEVHYAQLMNSGLYEELFKKNMLVAHREIYETGSFHFSEGTVLFPEQIPFISFPYEWSFDMWKDAALLTLHIAQAALQKGMMLKDATPFNIQFFKSRPIFIDTLSFENYVAGKPWIAYRQFCECFLAPLLLMHYCHPGTHKLFTVYPNGIPMDVLANLLPNRSKWNMNTMLHVHLQVKFAGKPNQKPGSENNFSKQKLEILLKGLESFVQKLSLKKIKTTWDDYYTGTILGDDYLIAKTALVKTFISDLKYGHVIDLGANDGHFSSLFAPGIQVIATDADPNCINDLYLRSRQDGRANILPLVIDFTSPSPAIGWNNAERESITSRLKADLVLALALVHHLAIAKNVPLHLIAAWLQPMGEHLIIEFVPKTDEKVKLLLQNRKDIFDKYDLENFKTIFANTYQVVKEEKVGNTDRVLFLMKRK
ncbi:MAG: class I SAM-dependent methyltransferase [Chitinophagaceae bacterium]|nr:class I SAM-dependent methyltransferase [Chitinophagaceae bacterium]